MVFFLVIHDSSALGQPTDVMNHVCSALHGYNQALGFPRWLTLLSFVDVSLGEKSKTSQYFSSACLNDFNDTGITHCQELWEP